MTLPPEFGAFPASVALLTLTDLERVDRGLPAIAGLSPQLNAEAQAGAAAGNDPNGPDGFAWASNWSGSALSLFNDLAWMYDDGPGSGNLDCAHAGQAGCWGHRDNILGVYADPVGMGAAAQGSSQTQLFVAGYTPAAPGGADAPVAPLWSSIMQTQPVGVAPSPVILAHNSATRSVAVWASGEAMDVHAATSENWTVTPAECNLAAGSSCALTVTAPVSQKPAAGTLTLTGPNGPQTVSLERHIAVQVSARLRRASIRAHRVDAVTGTVTPVNPGQSVLLELRRGARWSAVSRTTLDPRGNLTIRFRPNTQGKHSYRIHVPAANGYEEAVSSTLTLHVAAR